MVHLLAISKVPILRFTAVGIYKNRTAFAKRTPHVPSTHTKSMSVGTSTVCIHKTGGLPRELLKVSTSTYIHTCNQTRGNHQLNEIAPILHTHGYMCRYQVLAVWRGAGPGLASWQPIYIRTGLPGSYWSTYTGLAIEKHHPSACWKEMLRSTLSSGDEIPTGHYEYIIRTICHTQESKKA